MRIKERDMNEPTNIKGSFRRFFYLAIVFIAIVCIFKNETNFIGILFYALPLLVIWYFFAFIKSLKILNISVEKSITGNITFALFGKDNDKKKTQQTRENDEILKRLFQDDSSAKNKSLFSEAEDPNKYARKPVSPTPVSKSLFSEAEDPNKYAKKPASQPSAAYRPLFGEPVDPNKYAKKPVSPVTNFKPAFEETKDVEQFATKPNPSNYRPKPVVNQYDDDDDDDDDDWDDDDDDWDDDDDDELPVKVKKQPEIVKKQAEYEEVIPTKINNDSYIKQLDLEENILSNAQFLTDEELADPNLTDEELIAILEERLRYQATLSNDENDYEYDGEIQTLENSSYEEIVMGEPKQVEDLDNHFEEEIEIEDDEEIDPLTLLTDEELADPNLTDEDLSLLMEERLNALEKKKRESNPKGSKTSKNDLKPILQKETPKNIFEEDEEELDFEEDDDDLSEFFGKKKETPKNIFEEDKEEPDFEEDDDDLSEFFGKKKEAPKNIFEEDKEEPDFEEDDDDLSEFFNKKDDAPKNIFEEFASKVNSKVNSKNNSYDYSSGVEYNKSFEALLIQSEGLVQDYYSNLKNEILSYERVKSKMMWRYDNFTYNGISLVKIAIEDDDLLMYFALDPSEYEDSKYKIKDASNKKGFEDVPAKLEINNFKDVNSAKELISEMMDSYAIEKVDSKYEDYHMDYETNEELIEKGLIKVL